MQENTFLMDFFREFLRYAYHTRNNNNTTLYRFLFTQHPPIPTRMKQWLRETILSSAASLGFVYIGRNKLPYYQQDVLSFILSNADAFDNAYRCLSNQNSRQWMVYLLVYRTLKHKWIKIPLTINTKQVQQIKRTTCQQPRTFPVPMLGYLDMYDLHSLHFPVQLHAHLLNILCTFHLQQYRYYYQGTSIQAEAGDIVIDGGGCWGDTALYFAHKVGAQGRVYSFEFSPENLKLFQQNLMLNPSLANRIHVITEALWSVSGETISYDEQGPGSSITSHPVVTTTRAQTRSIDDFVQSSNLPRVDFVKLDIEGSELQALKGAEQTLRTFRPKLAIAAYHKIDDFITLTSYLDDLGLGYRFFIDHFTVGQAETVLFGQPVWIP